MESLMKGDREVKSKKVQRSGNLRRETRKTYNKTCRSVVFPAKNAKSYEAVEVCATLS